MIKFLQKGDYYLSLMRVAHCFLVRVEITCRVDEKKTSSYSQLSYKLEKKKHSRETYLNWKGNTKELTEKAL